MQADQASPSMVQPREIKENASPSDGLRYLVASAVAGGYAAVFLALVENSILYVKEISNINYET